VRLELRKLSEKLISRLLMDLSSLPDGSKDGKINYPRSIDDVILFCPILRKAFQKRRRRQKKIMRNRAAGPAHCSVFISGSA
jgi:hypothetical protein